MHGRPRHRPGEPAADTPEQTTKAALLRSLMDGVVENHRSRCYTAEALQQNARLLELNPEVYTAWNYRKLAVQHLLGKEQEDAAQRQSIVQEELRVVERALKANYKSYGAWYHRKWLIGLGMSSLDREFSLLSQLLKLDDRNFHGWDYRRFAVKASARPVQQELQYTTEKITENFSNYSAWHNRSAILSQLFDDKSHDERVLLEEEYELVKHAYWTEPDDQSAWFYQSWLLAHTVASAGPKVTGVWPLPGSLLSVQPPLDHSASRIVHTSPAKQNLSFHSSTLPIILCFSEPVSGVSHETVSIQASRKTEVDASWNPVSGNGASSTSWIAELELSSFLAGGSCEAAEHRIQVGIPEQSGIVSIGPGLCSGPLNFSFTLKLHSASNTATAPADDELQEDFVNPNGSGFGSKAQNQVVSQVSWPQNVIRKEIVDCRELLKLEPDSKWAKLTLARFLKAQDSTVSADFADPFGKHGGEIMKLFKELAVLDPSHAAFYWDQHSLLHVRQRISESMDSPGLNWYQLDQLSLTKFAGAERLLWVQKLDLSNNKLRSLDGLEALQLLTDLNISRNCIPSVSALVPLRHMRRLRTLDISHNEIGSHTVDPCRYLCPSLLSSNASALNQRLSYSSESWEIRSVFGSMQLVELSLAGNPAATIVGFRQALLECLPLLRVLDGVAVT